MKIITRKSFNFYYFSQLLDLCFPLRFNYVSDGWQRRKVHFDQVACHSCTQTEEFILKRNWCVHNIVIQWMVQDSFSIFTRCWTFYLFFTTRQRLFSIWFSVCSSRVCVWATSVSMLNLHSSQVDINNCNRLYSMSIINNIWA